MATFPAFTPSSRSFTPGLHPHSEIRTLNGLQTRVRTSNVVLEQRLRLTFLALTEAQMLSIRTHYLEQQGRFLSFDIPDDLLSGMSAPASFTPTDHSWIYAGQPQVIDVACGRHDVSVELATVPPEGANINGAEFTVGVSIAAGAATSSISNAGFDLTVTASLAAGAGTGTANTTGFDLTVNSSLEPGAYGGDVEFAASGAEFTVDALFAAGAASTSAPAVVGTFINSDSTADASHVLTTPTHNEGNLLIAVLMWRLPSSSITAPSGWTLHTGNLLPNIVFSGSQQYLHVYTKTATSSEPASHTWSAGSSVRNAGLIVSVENGEIHAITEAYGDNTTASIATVANRLNITAFTWLYAEPSGTESYSQSASVGTLTQITDSPKTQARLSGGYISSAATVTSTHALDFVGVVPSHGGICIQLT